MGEYKDLFGEDVKEKKEKPITYVGFVWDHSGSMWSCEKLAMDNFNEQLATLKKDSDKVDYITTIIEFDDKIKEVVVNESINMVGKLKDYWTDGLTALYDAIGRCVSKIDVAMNEDEREDKAALIIVMTDGQENASSDYNNESIKALIKKMDAKDNWSFVFMGAGIDERQAKDMGFGVGNTVSFSKTVFSSQSTSQSASLSNYSNMRARGVTKTTSFYDEDKKEEEDKEDE